jgi:hypothetical protein
VVLEKLVKKFPTVLNPKIHYYIYRNTPLGRILSKYGPIHTPTQLFSRSILILSPMYTLTSNWALRFTIIG